MIHRPGLAGGLSASWADLRAALLQFTRLPLPAGPPPPQGWARRGAWAWPVAGMAIGAVGALALALAAWLGLPPLLAAILAVAAMALASGALHEDGLADFADGIGGGRDRESRLRIMRDSRLGSYGTLALALFLLWRVGALAALPGEIAAAALLAVAAASRWSASLVAWRLGPANPDGQSAAAGRPGGAGIVLGGAFCLLLALLCLPAALFPVPALAAAAAAVCAGVPARRALGGQTGDVLGAAVLFAEAIGLAALLALHS